MVGSRFHGEGEWESGHDDFFLKSSLFRLRDVTAMRVAVDLGLPDFFLVRHLVDQAGTMLAQTIDSLLKKKTEWSKRHEL